MKARSVVVDVSIDQGGCFETSELTSHESPTFIKHGVIHYCVPNIPSRVARTASFSLSNLFLPLLRDIGDHGGIEQLIRTNRGLRQGMYMHRGAITNRGIAQWFELPFTDLDLMVSAW
jgi:alanine dehydrogenase